MERDHLFENLTGQPVGTTWGADIESVGDTCILLPAGISIQANFISNHAGQISKNSSRPKWRVSVHPGMECKCVSPCYFSLFGLSGWRTFLHGGLPSQFSFVPSRIPMPVSTWAKRLRTVPVSALCTGWIAASVEEWRRNGLQSVIMNWRKSVECVRRTTVNDLACRHTLSKRSFQATGRRSCFTRTPSYGAFLW